MRRIVMILGLALLIGSCANNESSTTTGNSDSVTTTTTNTTTSSGAAGTGGVGAGFGTGGSPTTDTGKVIRTDTSRNQNQQ
jgi:hypothetical protein